MNKIFTLLTAALLPFALSAQSLAPTVISTTGGFSENANGSLSYTVGEMTMVETFSNSNNILTQGFQQPNDITTGILDLVHSDQGSFVVYPNPAVDHLSYGFEFPQSGEIQVDVYDVLGQRVAQIYHSSYINGKTVEALDVSAYGAATYLMTLTFTPANGEKPYLISKRFQVIH